MDWTALVGVVVGSLISAGVTWWNLRRTDRADRESQAVSTRAAPELQ